MNLAKMPLSIREGFLSHFQIVQNSVADWAKAKGWWNPEENKGEKIALMHSELSEALEALRAKPNPRCPECNAHLEADPNDKYSWDCRTPMCRTHVLLSDAELVYHDDKIPKFSGLEAELADTIIRMMHFAEQHNLRLAEAVLAKMEYNWTRAFKHGKNF